MAEGRLHAANRREDTPGRPRILWNSVERAPNHRHDDQRPPDYTHEKHLDHTSTPSPTASARPSSLRSARIRKPYSPDPDCRRRGTRRAGRCVRLFEEAKIKPFPFPPPFHPSPAPAQSPAILLDIKSPATANPPNESLLTLDEEGNLWIKGQLYDYAFQSTITLDPAKKYWTLRDSTGQIVWALEVHNPGTGVSTGDLYSIGSFEGWAAEPDQPGAILRYTNASSEVVFSLSAAGEARSRRTAPQRGTPAPWPDPPALGAIPDSSDDPSTIDLRAEASGRDLYEIVPAPQAQGRIFFSVGPNWPVDADRDVTGIPWRLRWYPSITTLRDYGVHLGCRYRECYDQSQWWYQSADANGVFCEADAEVGMDGYGPLILWWPEAYGWGYFGSNWTVAYNPPVPPANDPPATPLTFGATWSDSAPSGWDSNWGDPVDTPTAAYTRLFLYWIEFDEKRKASAVPRKDGDRWMNVRCCLQPRPMPTGWINHIELTVWDPAVPSHKRVISGPSGQAWISTMWDGKLYMDGNENGTPFYTQASDVFMSATVFWNPLSPSKPWENVDETTFQEPRYAIVASDGAQPVSSCPTNFAWINAGDATTSPSMPALNAHLAKSTDDISLPTTANWKLAITFPRDELGAGTKDTSNYPATGSTPVAGDQAWTPNFGGEVRGGEAVFTCALATQTLTHKVHIRGLNPTDSSVLSRVSTVNHNLYQDAHWYAPWIAKYETKLWLSNAQDSEWGGELQRYEQWIYHGALYNQFYPRSYSNGTPNADAHALNYPGNPVHHHDNPQSVGYGMMQITNPAASPQEVWDWQANTNRGMQILRDDRTAALQHFALITNANSIEPTSMTIATVVLSNATTDTLRCRDLEVIHKYNNGVAAHFFLQDSPDPGNEWDRNVQLKYQGTAASLVTQPTTTTLESCSYVERVLGVGAPN